MRIVSWNINGIRSVASKGFETWLKSENADIICLQETRALPEQVPAGLLRPEGFYSYWNAAEKKGYSGVAIYTKIEPKEVRYGMGIPEFDSEGRLIELDFGSWVLINGYYPNGGASDERLDYKMRFYSAFLQHIRNLRLAGKSVILCGDLNTCHKEIDLARPKENRKVSGFLPIECAWMDDLVQAGWTDTFRHFYPQTPGRYSWWSNRGGARERNVGWRIDYFFASNDLLPKLSAADIHDQVKGSDHCPISMEIEF